MEKGIHWRTFRDGRHSLKRLHMKIRPVDYKSQGEEVQYISCLENKCRKMGFPVTVSFTEDDADYYGNDVTGVLNGLNNKQPDVESCRSSCISKGAKYFSWSGPRIIGNAQNVCWCKTSNSGRVYQLGKVSGDVGGGE